MLPFPALDQKLMQAFSFRVRRRRAILRLFHSAGDAVSELAEPVKSIFNIFVRQPRVVGRVSVHFHARARRQLIEIEFDAVPLAAIGFTVERPAKPLANLLEWLINELLSLLSGPAAA